jgi:hypothetical protein
MSEVLSIRLEDELYTRVHTQTVSPRQVVTEALLQYFRYKDGEINFEPNIEDPIVSKINVYKESNEPVDKDIESIRLQMEINLLKAKIELKDNQINDKESIIVELRFDKRFLQGQMRILRMHFMPSQMGFFAGLLPSGRKALKAQAELDEFEMDFIKSGRPGPVITIEPDKTKKDKKKIKK